MGAQEIYKNVEDVFNRHDVDACVALFTTDGVVIAPNSPEPIKGADAIRADFAAWFQAFPDVHVNFVTILSQGDNAAVEVEVSGTHLGPLMGPAGPIPATNKTVSFKGSGFARFNNQDLLVEEHRYFDLAGMMAQLGLA